MDEKIKNLEKKAAELNAAIDALKAEAEKESEWPRHGENYIPIGSGGEAIRSFWRNDCLDKARKELGNIFHTEKETEDRVESLKWLAEKPERREKLKEWREVYLKDKTLIKF